MLEANHWEKQYRGGGGGGEQGYGVAAGVMCDGAGAREPEIVLREMLDSMSVTLYRNVVSVCPMRRRQLENLHKCMPPRTLDLCNSYSTLIRPGHRIWKIGAS